MKGSSYSQPPRLARRLLHAFCAPHLLEEMEGDLDELFRQRVQSLGERRARLRYWRDVLSLLRPFVIKPDPPTATSLLSPDMFKNYLTIALRTLWKNKGYAAIHVAGLSVAFCICVFLFLTAYLQLTFDSFHQESDRIFQSYFFFNDPERANRSGGMPLPLAPTLKAEYPEIEAATRVMNARKSLVEYQGKYLDKEVYLTDPDFLNIFSFQLLRGSRETALRELSSIVLSASTAEMLFGDEDPMGKQLLLGSEGNQKEYTVNGVLADPPYNSTIRYDAWIRIENAPNYHSDQNNWNAQSHQVFVKLASGVKQAAFESQLKSLVKKYFSENVDKLRNNGAQPDARGDLFAVRLQPLSKVHFDTEISKGPPIALVYTLLGIGFFILLIACINFINLSVARSFTRAREVGVRKYLGALRGQLFIQIWGESIVICFIGLLGGVLLAWDLLPQFNARFDMKINLSHLLEPGFIILIGGVFVLVTLIAGGYPAWLMARFNAVEVLKGKISLKRPGVLRNSLLVTQFVMSSLLACCTVIALQQVDYLRTRPLGFEKEQVISIPVGNQVDGRQVLQRLRNKLTADPSVLSVTGAGVNLGKGKDRISSRSTLGFTYQGKQVATDWLLVDYDYLKTLRIPLLAGREFDPAHPSDSLNRVIITESMAKLIGEGNPVGKAFRDDSDSTGAQFQVIGVVPDFHLYSLATEALPITMHLSASEPIRYVFVRMSPQSLKGAMNKLEKIWKEVAPQSAFMGSFLDENVDAWYQDEEMLSKIFSMAAAIAILLSCSGLFAVALLVIEQRTKEIGIRKVLGAGTTSIIVLLSKDFIKMVILALLIALPLARFLMQKWLEHYPHRIEISGWIFAGVGFAALLITLLTVSFQSVKTAMMNPVKSLRTE
jgi:ABC-type antimicrobial peptide transport system permease subunit